VSLELARKVADAVLFEGYLLYPYRATSRKNQVRWQFGVLGPLGAAAAGVGEESTMSADCLVRPGRDAWVGIHVRFLQLQKRFAHSYEGGAFAPVDELVVDDSRWLTWDEAVECEHELGPIRLADLARSTRLPVEVAGGRDEEDIRDPTGALRGRLVRERQELAATLHLSAVRVGELVRLTMRLENDMASEPDKDAAIGVSFIGTHLLMEIEDGEFVSTVNPPDDAVDAVAGCRQHRWWPVLAGPEDQARFLLVSPIIVEDHAQLAPESAGALFDSTEIDEILTLRVMTLTDEEKAEARATDPRAAEIIDRCDAMTPEQMQDLHGILRNPHAIAPDAVDDLFAAPDPFALPDELTWSAPTETSDHPVFTTEGPWWDPEADASVAPETDAVTIGGVSVRKGSLVRVHPNRRADAQDIFFSDMVAKVAAVLSDVDGDTHVAVTLVDDPAAEMHDWYGRYLYFAPDELEPLPMRTEELGPPRGEEP
jgi:hypothetical protein